MLYVYLCRTKVCSETYEDKCHISKYSPKLIIINERTNNIKRKRQRKAVYKIALLFNLLLLKKCGSRKTNLNALYFINCFKIYLNNVDNSCAMSQVRDGQSG
jgi:hypothetical protein